MGPIAHSSSLGSQPNTEGREGPALKQNGRRRRGGGHDQHVHAGGGRE